VSQLHPNPPTGATLVRDLALYTLARLALIGLLTALLVLAGVPLLVALLLSLVVALPLSLVLLARLRTRVNAGLRAAGGRRRAERDRLRAELRGERTPEDGQG
jgi:hypothetical protein